MATPFFQSKKAAAILKHAILDQYISPFAMKTGSTSQGGRVAIVDGYAGTGTYEDGSEGSPGLLLRKAREMSSRRRLECLFVEQDSESFQKLSRFTEDEGKGLDVKIFLGDVADNLTLILDETQGIPLFVFLDPFGLMIPFEDVRKILMRPTGVGMPTEVLINFSTIALRRIAGHLTSSNANEATLRRMDGVCDGDWWRSAWLDEAPTKEADDRQREAAEEAVVKGYATRLSSAAKAGYWTADVRNREHYRSAYHLVFLSRHRDGLYLFGESLSLGLEKWRRAIFDTESAGSLFEGDEEEFKAEEKALSDKWVKEITDNLRELLSEHGGFRIRDRYAEVYGDTLGKARVKHLRAAWKNLLREGITKTDSKGDLIPKVIEPA
ncbi:hypothetical protein amrb99_02740 [Actinomadura sp. RB99]|uniref:three-Cys-motif partner protein TcmP n=1 Tax=Actinomadura sp. RB99 TaxID=2691577 RepID=UPI0016846B03|nr:three-Cys-motif partner protein TcmP [Actinomadura sp. RB99]MBD2891369.1 hypothetical protein [Actinomadura sp. RB99]